MKKSSKSKKVFFSKGVFRLPFRVPRIRYYKAVPVKGSSQKVLVLSRVPAGLEGLKLQGTARLGFRV